ncbi:MAG TPA: hypothetical protein P5273_09815 [Syntrophomonadaceae bacterium]|nr:hypothetical protein [Syntrophomonadaceae bacterium]
MGSNKTEEILIETDESIILKKTINKMEVSSVFPKHRKDSEKNFENFLRKLNTGCYERRLNE